MKMILNCALVLTALSLFMPCVNISARAADATNHATATALQRLQGTWEGFLVGNEAHGKITLTITDHSLRFHRDTNFWFETTFTLPAGTDPQQLHATIKDGAPGQENSVGQVVVAIYKIEDEKLTLVTRGDGDEETLKSFEATEDQELARYEFRKIQPQAQ